ncbi:universal stress protein [Glycomyces terrestris]|uniref:Universal stress protein n=1 Tax=Glycomyces terrestris TaxID=2493553 RepID=A0A426V3G5_9ACTN|nr:universal stress protein [Glycomyces terrestris]RRS01439.1 universal stress protein [Glycomyces terrestris]
MTDRHSERIVVAIDGSPPSLDALRWAIAYADRCGAIVEALHVWHIPNEYGTPVPAVPGETFEATAKRSLQGSIDEVVGDRTDAPVEAATRQGYPPKVLVERSAAADLLVVGSRGRGALAGTLLGSVSLHCVTHAHCPVVVIRG